MAGYRLLPQWTLGTGHSSPPLTRSFAHRVSMETPLFVPRHPLVRASFHHSFSKWWDRGCSEALLPAYQASLTGCVFSQEEPVAWPQWGKPP